MIGELLLIGAIGALTFAMGRDARRREVDHWVAMARRDRKVGR